MVVAALAPVLMTSQAAVSAPIIISGSFSINRSTAGGNTSFMITSAPVFHISDIHPPAVNNASLVLGITVSTITLLNELAIPEAIPPSYSPELFFVPISHGKNLSFTNGTIYLDIKPTAIGIPAATLTPNHTLPIPLIILPINDLESSTFSAALSEKVSTKEPSFVLIPFIESKNDLFSAVFSASSLEPFFGASFSSDSFSSDSFSIGSSPSSA